MAVAALGFADGVIRIKAKPVTMALNRPKFIADQLLFPNHAVQGGCWKSMTFQLRHAFAWAMCPMLDESVGYRFLRYRQ